MPHQTKTVELLISRVENVFGAAEKYDRLLRPYLNTVAQDLFSEQLLDKLEHADNSRVAVATGARALFGLSLSLYCRPDPPPSHYT